MLYFYKNDKTGATEGPVDAETLKKMATTGHLLPTTKVAPRGTVDWEYLKDTIDLPLDQIPEPQSNPEHSRKMIIGDHPFATFCLSIAQIVMALACIGIPIWWAAQVCFCVAQLGQQTVDHHIGIVFNLASNTIAAFVSFCVSAALYIVFGRTKRASAIAATQEADYQNLWLAIDKLRMEDRQIKPNLPSTEKSEHDGQSA